MVYDTVEIVYCVGVAGRGLYELGNIQALDREINRLLDFLLLTDLGIGQVEET